MFPVRKVPQSRKGFTLIELVMVLIIIGALAAIVASRIKNTDPNTGINALNLKKYLDDISSHQLNTSGKIPDGPDLINNTADLPKYVMGDNGSWIDATSIWTTTNLTTQQIQVLKDQLGVAVVYHPGETEPSSLTTNDQVVQIDTTNKIWRNVGSMEDISGCFVFGLGDHLKPYTGASGMSVGPGSGKYLYDQVDSSEKINAYYPNFLLLVRIDSSGTSAEYVGCIDPRLQGVHSK